MKTVVSFCLFCPACGQGLKSGVMSSYKLLVEILVVLICPAKVLCRPHTNLRYRLGDVACVVLNAFM